MAEKPQIIGKIGNGPFETTGRTEAWAEARTWSATVVGKWQDVRDRFKIGDAMSKHSSVFKGDWNGAYFIKNISAQSNDGVTGEVALSLVMCDKGKTKPFAVTWQAGMEEVQMKLINHPDIQKNADIDVLLKWEDTDPGLRVAKDKDGNVTYWYVDKTQAMSDGAAWTYQQVTGDWNLAYCTAVTAGITTYNRYLPTLTKVSQYLELEGIRYDSDSHMITGGKITDFTGPDAIGQFAGDDLEIKIEGYTSEDGVWFKSGDSYSSNADGSWTRTESWVFTNDTRHNWIYTHQLGDGDTGKKSGGK